MRPDLTDILDFLSWKRHQVLLDAKEYLSLDFPVIFAQEFKIRKETAGNRIFNGHDGCIRPAFIHAPVQAVEGITLDNARFINPYAVVELTGSLFMETTFNSLNRNVFHLVYRIFCQSSRGNQKGPS